MTIIDLTSFFPWRILMAFAQSFALFNIVHALLKDKFHPLITFGSIFALRTIISIISLSFTNNNNLDFLFLLLFLALSFVLNLFLTEGSALKKVTPIIFYLISFTFTAFSYAMYTEVLFNGKDFYSIYNVDFPKEDFTQVYFANLVLTVSISFLFAGILKLFKSRKSQFNNKKLYAYFSFLPLTHLFFIILNFICTPYDYTPSADYDFKINFLIFATTSIILIFDCSFPFILDHFEKAEIENNERKKELVKAKINYQQTQYLKDELQSFRKIKHDFLNIIATAKGFIEIGKPEKAMAILNQTNDDITMPSGFSTSGSDTINTILFIKEKQAKESEITLNIDIDESYMLYVDDYSICRVMHNIIDNAIEASSNTPEKYVDLKIKIEKESFTFTCKNPFRERTQKENEQRVGRGNGTNIIKEIVKNYNGTYSCSKDENIFISTIVMENKKNIQ